MHPCRSGPRHRCRPATNQCRLQRHVDDAAVRPGIIEPCDQSLHRRTCQPGGVLANRRERYVRQACQWAFVEAEDGDVLWYMYPGPDQDIHHAERATIVEREYGGV